MTDTSVIVNLKAVRLITQKTLISTYKLHDGLDRE